MPMKLLLKRSSNTIYESLTRRLNEGRSIEQARRDARTRTLKEPSDEQKAAGNYPKGKFWWNGYEIAIETPKGAYRRGRDKSGEEWAVKMTADYGYFRRTESEADGDHIDCFLGPDLSSPVVYIINQNGKDGRFDEHKCIVGVRSDKEAKDLYHSNYSPGWRGFGSMEVVTTVEFLQWLDSGDTKKPYVK